MILTNSDISEQILAKFPNTKTRSALFEYFYDQNTNATISYNKILPAEIRTNPNLKFLSGLAPTTLILQ
jgi:hypothetical protein